MRIAGLQKLTLLDFPGKVACTMFTAGCNFRCPFCQNASLVLPEKFGQPFSEEEILSFLRKRQGVLDGVAITGGEPMLHADLPDFLRKIRELGFLVKLDTNGYHPHMLGSLLADGLVDYVAMDIKNSPQNYARTCGLETLDLAPVQESVNLLMQGDTDYEFRTTVVDELHAEQDFEAIGRWIAGAKQYYLQCFTDRDSVPFGNLHAPSREKLARCAAIAGQWVPNTHVRGVDGLD